MIRMVQNVMLVIRMRINSKDYRERFSPMCLSQVPPSSKVTIKNANTAKASFDALSASELTGSDTSTTLSFQLTVTENGGPQSSDITTVEIYTENTPPVANSQSVTTTTDTSASITYVIESFPNHGSLSSLDKDSGAVT